MVGNAVMRINYFLQFSGLQSGSVSQKFTMKISKDNTNNITTLMTDSSEVEIKYSQDNIIGYTEHTHFALGWIFVTHCKQCSVLFAKLS